jgi:hypothetical protein
VVNTFLKDYTSFLTVENSQVRIGLIASWIFRRSKRSR